MSVLFCICPCFWTTSSTYAAFGSSMPFTPPCSCSAFFSAGTSSFFSSSYAMFCSSESSVLALFSPTLVLTIISLFLLARLDSLFFFFFFFFFVGEPSVNSGSLLHYSSQGSMLYVAVVSRESPMPLKCL